MALREINLITSEILYRQHLLRHICFWAGCLVISLSLILGIYLYQTHAVLDKKRTLTKLQRQYRQLGAKIEEIKQIQQELSRLNEQQAVLNRTTRNQPYSQLFLRLAQIMNERTWLTQLAIEGGTDAGGTANLKLTGFSHSNKELGAFVNRLSNEPAFKAVVLRYAKEAREVHSRERTRSPLSLIQFQIECHV